MSKAAADPAVEDDPVEIEVETPREITTDALPGDKPTVLTLREPFEAARFVACQRRMAITSEYRWTFVALGLLFDDDSAALIESAMANGSIEYAAVIDIFVKGVEARAARPTK